MNSLIILPVKQCRRSRGIPYQQIDPESEEGQRLMEQYSMRASPGILVNGVSLNPLELFLRPNCKINEDKAKEWFGSVIESKSP